MLADKELLESILSFIGKRLRHEVNGLLIGGNAMMYYGLKEQTKDCDVVLFNRIDIAGITRIILSHPLYRKAKIFKELPYRIKPELLKKGEPTVIGNSDLPRFDLFYKYVFSIDVKSIFKNTKRSIRFELFKLKIANPEDLIFLKSVTGRPVDIEDIVRLVSSLDIDWNIFLQSIKDYHKFDKKPMWFILGTLYDINKKEKIIPKFVIKEIEKLF